MTWQAFKQWDDVKEILDDGVVQEATLDILISEVKEGSGQTQTPPLVSSLV